MTLYQDLASTFRGRSAIIAVNKGPNLYFVKLHLNFFKPVGNHDLNFIFRQCAVIWITWICLKLIK